MTSTSASGPAPVTGSATRPHRRAGHFLEMLVAMFAGMLLLGWVRDALGWTVQLAEHPGTWYLLMATDMAIGMAGWMTLRGCRPRHTVEMCVAMYVPLVLVPLVWLDLLGTMTFMTVAHVVMVLAMLAVVVRRPDHR